MCKIGRCTTLLFGLASIALVASCAREGTVVVSFDPADNESAWYPIDVANWIFVYDQDVYYPTYNDATADLQATLIDASTGQPLDSRVIHLDSYSVVWDNSHLHIPTLTGALDVTVPANANSSEPARFTLLVMPAVDKETVSVLANLDGDPSSDWPTTFNGELVATATIDFLGHDLGTSDTVSASLHLTAAFADYPDPNSYH